MSFTNPAELVRSVNRMLEKWKSIEKFLAWDYSENHLSMDSDDISHCCHCALGGVFIEHMTTGPVKNAVEWWYSFLELSRIWFNWH